MLLPPPQWLLDELKAPTKEWATGDLGKILFLDAMGFACPSVMRGDFLSSPSYRQQMDAYSDVLRPRHDVLGWWAREGFCGEIVTTNFDLLLEGGLRRAGLAYAPGGSQGGRPFPARTGDFHRISCADDFFEGSSPNRAARLLKIHGCAEGYRKKRGDVVQAIDDLGKAKGKAAIQAAEKDRDKALGKLRQFLPSIVFSYREIQGWRTDAWARDLVANLLRSRSVLLLGYSGQDPVIHDSFRTIYEEMARYRAKGGTQKEIPVYYLDYEGNSTFYSREIVRAAGQASGWPEGGFQSDGGHPNLGGVYPKGRVLSTDRALLLMHHFAVRGQQGEFLENYLVSALRLIGVRNSSKRDRTQILGDFRRIAEDEEKELDGLAHDSIDPLRIEEFHQLTGWSTVFATGYLRLLAFSHDDSAAAQRRHRERRWMYCAGSEHPEWVVVGVLLELAIRRLVAQKVRRNGVNATPVYQWPTPNGAVGAKLIYGSNAPRSRWRRLVAITSDYAPDQSTIELAEAFPRKPAYRHAAVWAIPRSEVPWPDDAASAKSCPLGEDIWNWACGRDVQEGAKHKI